MSTKKKKTAKQSPHSVVWFEIPADDPKRAKTFYNKLFGWKINAFPASARVGEYWHIDTGGADASPDGGMLKRMHAGHTITQYVLVPSVEQFMAKVEKLGGKVCVEKTAVPNMGYFAICQDTEDNTFAIWEHNEEAE